MPSTPTSGHTCVGAKVNGRIVPLRYSCTTATLWRSSPRPANPSQDWLSLVKTSRARNKIKHVINIYERAKAIEIGQKFLEKEARRLGVALSHSARRNSSGSPATTATVRSKICTPRWVRAFLGATGPSEACRRQVPAGSRESSKPLRRRPAVRAPRSEDLVLKVKGADDLMVYRAKCCNPIPRSRIVGTSLVVRGLPFIRSIVRMCRTYCTRWSAGSTSSGRAAHPRLFPVKMVIYTDDRPGVLNQLTAVLAGEKSNIRSLEASRTGARRRRHRRDDRGGQDKRQFEKDRFQDAAQAACAMSRGSCEYDAITSLPEAGHVAVSKSKGIKIYWADGHQSEYGLTLPARPLPMRHLHPCTHGTLQRARANPFQMYDPPLKINAVEPAGSYAIGIKWNDGHELRGSTPTSTSG